MKKTLFFPVVMGMISCVTGEKDPAPPNILWITNEDLSLIYGCYGDEYARTTNIDNFADSGYRFVYAFSNSPICAPARLQNF